MSRFRSSGFDLGVLLFRVERARTVYSVLHASFCTEKPLGWRGLKGCVCVWERGGGEGERKEDGYGKRDRVTRQKSFCFHFLNTGPPDDAYESWEALNFYGSAYRELVLVTCILASSICYCHPPLLRRYGNKPWNFILLGIHNLLEKYFYINRTNNFPRTILRWRVNILAKCGGISTSGISKIKYSMNIKIHHFL